jgi:HEAT repeat protein/phage FluMu protein Com
MLNVPCPQCKALLQMPEEFAGQVVRCPKCKAMMRVASPGTSKSPTHINKRSDTEVSAGVPPPLPKAGNRANHPKTVIDPPASVPTPLARSPAAKKPFTVSRKSAIRASQPQSPNSGRLRRQAGLGSPAQSTRPPRPPVRTRRRWRIACFGLFLFLAAGGGGAVCWFYFREPVPPLMEDLDSPDRQVRCKAAEELGKLGPRAQEAVEKLVSKLAEDDGQVREMVKVALGRIGPPSDVALLLRYLHDDNKDVRYYAAEVLVDKVQDAPPDVLKVLKDAFEDERNRKNARLRSKLMTALVKFGNQDTDLVVPLILNALNDDDPEVQDRAKDGLQKHAVQAVRHKDPHIRERAFIAICNCEDRHVRRRASLEAFGQKLPWNLHVRAQRELELARLFVHNKEDFDALKDFLEHKNPVVRRQALWLMSRPDVPDRGLVLRALLRGLGDIGTRDVVQKGLAEMKMHAKHDLPVLKEFVANENVDIRDRVLKEFSRPDVPERSWVVGVLLDARLNPKEAERIRTTALTGLSELLDGTADWEIIKQRNLARQPDEAVRRLAVQRVAKAELTVDSASVLSQVLSNKNEKRDIRLDALRAFTQPNLNPEIVRPALVNVLRDSDQNIVGKALGALQKLPPPSPSEIKAENLFVKNLPVQLYTAYSAGRLGREAPDVLRQSLNSDARDVRLAALEGMRCNPAGKIDLELIEKEFKFADFNQADVRLELVKVLAVGTLTLARAQLLRERLEKDEKVEVRKAALDAFTKPNLEPESVRQPLVNALDDKEVILREMALNALNKLPPPTAAEVDVLAYLLKKSKRESRIYAANALRNLGSDAKGAVPALTVALADPDDEVANLSAQALGQIGPAAATAIHDLAKAAMTNKKIKRRQSTLQALIDIENSV